jgi:hypothetical protein
MSFITPRPTNSSKERLSFTWNSSCSTASEGYAYAEVKKLLDNDHIEQDQRINPLAPAVLLRSCV